MNPLYTLKKEGNDFIVSDVKGQSKDIPLTQYDGDIKSLFQNYVNNNPNHVKDLSTNLRFEKTENKSWKIIYGNSVLDEILNADVVMKVKGEEKFLDSIEYSQILRNSKSYENQNKKVSSDSGIMENVNDAIGEFKRGRVRSTLNKYKGLALIVAGTAMAVSLTYGLSGGCSSSTVNYENQHYVDGTMDRKLKGMKSSLVEFKDKYKNDKDLALLDVEEILWFNKQADKSKLSEENRMKLEKLVEMAKKLKEAKQ